MEGESTVEQEFSSLLMCGCMLLSMIVFPLAQKAYNNMRKKQKEKERVRKYKRYIGNLRDNIFKEISVQKDILTENFLPSENVRDVILKKSRNLWERKLEHEDFLDLRVGRGTRKPEIEIKAPEEHFSLEEDDLKKTITELVETSNDIVDVPITLNFRINNKVGLIGEKQTINSFVDNLMLQVMAYHGYDMLRVVILTDENNKSYWGKFISIPYLWNNDKSIRYFATNKDDINKVTGFLMEEYNYRKEMVENKQGSISFNPYYLILTDDIVSVKNNAFINEILKSDNNLGYSVVMGVEKVNALPNECSMFLNIVRGYSGIFTNQLSSENQIDFKPDFVDYSIKDCIVEISNIPMDINSGKYVLPKKYGFLEMFDVGNVNQLNILNRWKENNIIKSLETPVGIDEQGELNTKFSSTTDGASYYYGSVTLSEPNQVPNCTFFSIKERIGEVKTYSNVLDRKFEISLPASAKDTALGNWYIDQVDSLKVQLKADALIDLDRGKINQATLDMQLDFFEKIVVVFG